MTKGLNAMWASTSSSTSIPGAISISSRPLLPEAEHAALGDEQQHRLPPLGRKPAAGHLLDGVDELRAASFLDDCQLPLPDTDLQPSGREGADEDQLAGVLRDVDEATGSGEAVAEAADIDVAVPVRLRQPEARSSPPPS